MRTYEDLVGAEGRRVFYRAERFNARDLFPRRTPVVFIGGNRFDLENISMTGLAARARHCMDATPQPEDDVDVVFEGVEGPLFSGRARVERIARDPMEMLIGLSFTGAPLDVSKLVSRYNESLLRRELNGGLHHGLDCVPSSYRQHCADVLHLLRRYSATLRKFEGTVSGEPSPSDLRRLDELYLMCEERILPEWRGLWCAGNALIRPLMDDPDHLMAAKDFTEHVLTPEFLAGPIWNRSYSKPLGYPGDFEIMNYVYEWKPRGNTVYERLVHRIGLEVVECIATRMVMVQQAIADAVAAAPASEGSASVLSLGAGPAQEVSNYLDIRNPPRGLDVTLVDQDHRALSFAYKQIFPKVMARSDGSRLRCLQVSFVDLLKPGKTFAHLSPQDLIYSVGLVDYLSIKRARALVRRLYDMLKPGGTLAIANVADVADSGQWPSEFICDWSMHFRSERDMEDMAVDLPGAKRVIRRDTTGRVFILYLTKTRES